MTFSPMPLHIETERLVLTPEEPSDAEWFTELLNTWGTGTLLFSDTLERSRNDKNNRELGHRGAGAPQAARWRTIGIRRYRHWA